MAQQALIAQQLAQLLETQLAQQESDPGLAKGQLSRIRPWKTVSA
jgi:hypothetical protein